MIFAGDFSILLRLEVLFHPVIEGLVVPFTPSGILNAVYPLSTPPLGTNPHTEL